MDRLTLGAYLTAQYAPLVLAATPAGLTWSYDAPIDDVYGYLGIDEATWYDSGTVVPDGKESDARALGRYCTLRLLAAWVAPQVDNKSGDQANKFSQMSTQIGKLLDDAKAQVPSIYPLDSGDFAYGRLQLDFLEPDYPSARPYFGYW